MWLPSYITSTSIETKLVTMCRCTLSTSDKLVAIATLNARTLKVRLMCRSFSTSPIYSSKHTSLLVIIVGMFKIDQKPKYKLETTIEN